MKPTAEVVRQLVPIDLAIIIDALKKGFPGAQLKYMQAGGVVLGSERCLADGPETQEELAARVMRNVK